MLTSWLFQYSALTGTTARNRALYSEEVSSSYEIRVAQATVAACLICELLRGNEQPLLGTVG